MKRFVMPEFNSAEALIDFYRELSLPKMKYKKGVIEIEHSDGEIETQSIIYDDFGPEPKINRQNYPRTRRAGIVRTFDESWIGALYNTSPIDMARQIGPELALIFKIDCDLARAKTGSLDPAIDEYAVEGAGRNRLRAARIAMEAEIREASRNESTDKTSRPKRRRRRSNVEDLRRRYGSDPTALEWIESHEAELNAADDAKGFVADVHRDAVLGNSYPLDGRDD